MMVTIQQFFNPNSFKVFVFVTQSNYFTITRLNELFLILHSSSTIIHPYLLPGPSQHPPPAASQTFFKIQYISACQPCLHDHMARHGGMCCDLLVMLLIFQLDLLLAFPVIMNRI